MWLAMESAPANVGDELTQLPMVGGTEGGGMSGYLTSCVPGVEIRIKVRAWEVCVVGSAEGS